MNMENMCYESRRKNYSGGGRGPVIRKGEMREDTNKNKMQLYTFTNISQRNSSLHILTRKKREVI